jgi:hypothetical protein
LWCGNAAVQEIFMCTLQRHNTENSKQIFPEKELRDINPNSYIHVSVSDLCIPMIGLPILLQEIGGPIVEIYRSITGTWMWKNGNEAAQFLFWEYKDSLQCSTNTNIWVTKLIFDGTLGKFGDFVTWRGSGTGSASESSCSAVFSFHKHFETGRWWPPKKLPDINNGSYRNRLMLICGSISASYMFFWMYFST